MYYTVIKHSGHLRTLEKCRKHSPAARVFYISLVFSNARRVSSQCNTRLRLLYLLNKMWLIRYEITNISHSPKIKSDSLMVPTWTSLSHRENKNRFQRSKIAPQEESKCSTDSVTSEQRVIHFVDFWLTTENKPVDYFCPIMSYKGSTGLKCSYL